MADLCAGYSAKIVLGASQVLRVSASGQSTVTALSGAPSIGPAALNANTQDFGPYGVQAVLKLTCTTGTAVYGVVSDEGILTRSEAQSLRDALDAGGSIDSGESDPLPQQSKLVTVTGQVVAGPCKAAYIRCLAGSAVTILLRDTVVQTAAGTDTTSPILVATTTMSAGDPPLVIAAEAAFGLHATITGTSPTFEIGF